MMMRYTTDFLFIPPPISGLTFPPTPDLPFTDRRFHPCCGRPQGVAGCQHSENHVTDTMLESVLLEFKATPKPTGPSDSRSDAFYALDCEFVYTTVGKEAARITVVDGYGNEVMDCVFRPEHELVDPNTRYSGLTVEDIESSDKTLSDIREILFEMINSETLLIGHALENDLKALRIVHDNVIDTSVLFSRSSAEGRCFKQSLKSLAREQLDMDIQS
ncbi:exonuclease, partial [Teladorsagia circumcincta]